MGKGQRVQTQACSCAVGADKERGGFYAERHLCFPPYG
jgi:hypothetical protein